MTTVAVNSGIKKSKRAIPNSVMGMALFVLTETMFFTALVSAYLVIKAGYGYWAPPQGLTLPVAMTGVNTFVLLLSGALLFLAGRSAAKDKNRLALQQIVASVVLGAVFVCVQGYEWIGLITYGFTLKSSVFAGTFFLLVGAHAIHALAVLLFLGYHCRVFYQKGIDKEFLTALQILWLFVVGIWPILYGVVYF